MNIDTMTVGEVKQIQSLLGPSGIAPHLWKIGQSYLIRTVTHYYTGKLVAVSAGELLLETAAWIADTGRYYDCLKKGTFNEVEPIIGSCIISRGAIVDGVEWQHELPLVQK